MRIVFVILISVFTLGPLLADCSSSGLWAFPKTETIKQNSWIILEAYATSQHIITSLNKEYPIYLEADGHKVSLVVKESHKGLFRLSQALLMPEEKLIAGKSYQLKIDHLEADESRMLSKWNGTLGEREPIVWRVEEGTDTTPPQLLSTPKLVDKRTMHFGCGPAVSADFEIQTEDESATWVKTEMVELESGKTTTYILSFTEANTLSVGHGMCSGAFYYKDNGNYKVRFSPMDICGNTTSQWTDWISFESPYEKHSNR